MKSGEAEDGREDKVIGAYRAASDALDERPSPAARAAILAAAARAVDAQPRDAATGATSQRAAASKPGGFATSKRPLALVASVLVATVAIVLSTNVERELPERAVAPVAQGDAPRDEARGAVGGDSTAPAPKREVDAIQEKRTQEASGSSASVALAEREMQRPGVNNESARAPAVNETARRADASRDASRGTPVPGADATLAVPEARVPPARSAPRTAPEQVARDNVAPGRSSTQDSMVIAKAVEPAPPPAGSSAEARAERQAAPASAPAAPAPIAPAPGVAANNAGVSQTAPPPAPGAPTTGMLATAPPAPTAPTAGASPAGNARDKAPADSAQRAAKEDGFAARAKPALRQAPAEEGRVGRVQAPVGLQGELAGSAQLARARFPALEVEVVNDPAAWMKRIVALREARLDEQADRELAMWRERYPAADVPANALRRGGTR